MMSLVVLPTTDRRNISMRTDKLLLLLLLGLVITGTVNPVDAQPAAQTKGKVFEADKGPSTIDVSNYPQEMREYYRIFVMRCRTCHPLARPINSNYSGDEWKAYVQRMMSKTGSGINPSNGKKIIEFLIYDSKVRKKGK